MANRIAISLDVISGATILYAARRVKFEASARIIPMMGVLSAFVFAAQMLNFPVLGGTSGHLVGGALLAILLGPMAAFLTMTTVIVAQALFLQDGGLLALGANIFNIGAVTAFGGYFVFRLLGGAGSSGKRLAIVSFSAGWMSMMLSAICCSLQLGLSGAIPLSVGLPAMAGYHAVIGIAEGGLTAGILAFLGRVRPDLVEMRRITKLGVADWLGAIVLVAIPILTLALAGSSSLPDPLQALLGEYPEASVSSSGVTTLLSPERYREYLWQALLLAALVGAAYLVSRLTQRGKGRP